MSTGRRDSSDFTVSKRTEKVNTAFGKALKGTVLERRAVPNVWQASSPRTEGSGRGAVVAQEGRNSSEFVTGWRDVAGFYSVLSLAKFRWTPIGRTP